MRVAIVAHNNAIGGGSSTAAIIADGFANRNWDVDLVFLSQKSLKHSNVIDARVDHVSPRVNKICFPSDNDRRDVLVNGYRLSGYISEHKPDLIVSSLLTANLSALIGRQMASADLQDTPLIMREITNITRSGKNSILNHILSGTAGLIYSDADAVISICHEMANEMRGYLPECQHKKLHVLYPPSIEPDMYARADENTGVDFLDTRTPGKASPPVFVNACRLNRQKDLPTLITAFADVVSEHPDARLVIVGEGPERLQLEAQIKKLGLTEHVLLPGYTENPFAYINKATAVVNSSVYEGYCKTLAQAIALGTPVITSNCPVGPSELASMQQGGQIFPTGDAGALSKAMLKAVDAERQRGYTKVAIPDMSAHTAQSVCDGLINIYEGIVTDRSAHPIQERINTWRLARSTVSNGYRLK